MASTAIYNHFFFNNTSIERLNFGTTVAYGWAFAINKGTITAIKPSSSKGQACKVLTRAVLFNVFYWSCHVNCSRFCYGSRWQSPC